jgi:aspartate racemase
LLEFVRRQRCTVLAVSAHQLQRIIFSHQAHRPILAGVRQLVVYGDRPATAAIDALAVLNGGAIRWTSINGTPETGISVSGYQPRLATDVAEPVSLGALAPGSSIELRDSHLQDVPVAVPGEICLAGRGLADGYIDDDAATRARFFTSRDGVRFFRTGEVGRYRVDGTIEYLGESGRYLRQRGFIFHPGDIEAALARHPAVADVAIVSQGMPSGEGRPVVYAVLRSSAAATSERRAELRSELGALALQEMPDGPKILAYVFVDQIPRREDGRVIAASLPPCGPSDYEPSEVVAPRDELETCLIELWQELLEVRPIGITQSFFEIGGNSVTAARLFARVNARWGKQVPLATLFEAPTIMRLAELLREESWVPGSSSLVAIRASGSRPPLIIISGLGGNVVRFHDLARLLDPQQPVYALQPRGLDGRGECLTRIEQMDEHYIEAIRGLQPTGPYYLAGYSFGGLVTFEIAQQFHAMGERVALLAMLDAPEWRYLTERARKLSVHAKLRRYREITSTLLFDAGRGGYLKERLRRRSSNLIYSLFTRLGRALPQSIGTIQDINAFAASQYRPRPYAGRLAVFRTHPEMGTPIDDDTLGWTSLVLGKIDVYEVPGGHDDLTAQPNVQVLAQKLTRALERAQLSSPAAPSTVVKRAAIRADAGVLAGHTGPTITPILLKI